MVIQRVRTNTNWNPIMKLTKLFKNLLCAFAAVSLSLFTVSCDSGEKAADDAADAAGDAADAVKDAAGDAADAVKDAAGDAADAVKDAAKPE
jgi:hypothetical protein